MRSIPCLACANSAASGKSTGECYDNATGGSKRCFRCAKNGRACRPTPLAASVFAQLLVEARAEDPRSSECKSLLRLYKTAYDHRDAFDAVLARREAAAPPAAPANAGAQAPNFAPGAHHPLRQALLANLDALQTGVTTAVAPPGGVPLPSAVLLGQMLGALRALAEQL